MSKTRNKYSPEVRERAVRLVLDNSGQHESRWAAIVSVSAKIGCAANTLTDRVKKAEVGRGDRAGVTTEMADRVNNRRLPEPIGTIPPAEAETNYCAAPETQTMAA